MRTLLQLTQAFCITQGIPKPAAVVSSLDETVLQIWGLLNTEVMELGDRADWTALRIRSRFQHSLGANYLALALSSIAGFKGILPRTLWNESVRLPVNGPIPEAVWQQLILLEVTQSQYNFRIYNNGLYIYPETTDSSYFNMECQSNAGVLSAGGTEQVEFLADDDVPRMPDQIVYAGLIWRWKAAKGQPYAEEQRTYELMVAKEMNRETAPGELRLDGPDPDSRIIAPGLLIAAGNWPV